MLQHAEQPNNNSVLRNRQNQIRSVIDELRHTFHPPSLFVYIPRRPPLLPRHLDALRRLQYEEVKGNLESERCSICLENFSSTTESLFIQLPCHGHHLFHEQCILIWLEDRDTCPLCQERITPRMIERDAVRH